MMLAPAVLAIALVIIFPFFFELRLAFGNLNLYTIRDWIEGGDIGWVGFQHFVDIFTSSPLQTITFWSFWGVRFYGRSSMCFPRYVGNLFCSYSK